MDIRGKDGSDPHPLRLHLFARNSLPGLVVMVFGLFYLSRVGAIHTGASSYSAVPAWAFPLFVGISLVAVGLLLFIPGAWRALTSTPSAEDVEALEPPLSWPHLLGGAGILIGYIAILAWIGFVPATTLMIVLMARVLGSKSWRRDVIYALIFSLLAYLLFNYGVHVALPTGSILG